MTDSDKHSSLPRYGINWGRKKFYETGSRGFSRLKKRFIGLQFPSNLSFILFLLVSAHFRGQNKLERFTLQVFLSESDICGILLAYE